MYLKADIEHMNVWYTEQEIQEKFPEQEDRI